MATQPLQSFPVIGALDATAQLIPRGDSGRTVARRRSALGWAFARQAAIATVIVRKGCETSVDARAAMMVAKRVDRMRCDWGRLNVLGECNPGVQAGRTTANAILPVRTAAEYCVATKTEMAVLLDALKWWCFDTPANLAIELALMRLGVIHTS